MQRRACAYASLLGSLLLGLGWKLAACTPEPTTSQASPSAVVGEEEARVLFFGDDAFQARLKAAVAAKGSDYQPRTRHKNDDGSPKFVNRLIFESSPYLLQHAHNPVNWFPWGDEAFELAKKLGRPVFLSVGYSTCHWCHVMEEESFEDEEIAKYINEHYVPIKVDREERPDVDAVYMRSVMLMTGNGGWPMSLWLTTDRKPFFGGTYFPARDGDRGKKKGFLTLLAEQHKAYETNPNGIANDAERLSLQLEEQLKAPEASDLPSPDTVETAAGVAARRYDPMYGGPRGQPKFPSSFPIRLLLRYGLRAHHAESTNMALDTLRKMQAGGIYDHVGGGFHRYSVDERWLVPHFEKMLYDNALLATAYLEGFQVSGEVDLGRVAREILDYVDREMTAPGGGYYSATDADSLAPNGKREEGYYFTWTPAEIDEVLGKDKGTIVRGYYGVSDAGNFDGRNILYAPKTRKDAAAQLGIDVPELRSALGDALPLLRAARAKRPAPLRDDKILVAWNGLMISAMARGSRVLGEPRFRQNAETTARLLLDKAVAGKRLQHTYRPGGGAGGVAFAEDYAFFAAGLLDLFEATQDASWLRAAIKLMKQLDQHHKNDAGAYYRTANDHEKLLAREVEARDGAIPSAGSVAAMNQLRLYTLTTDETWRQRAERTMRGYASVLLETPWALDEMMLAVDYMTDSPKEVVLALPDDMAANDDAAEKMLAVMRKRFVPNHVFILATKAALGSGGVGALVPWSKDKPAQSGKPTAYVCEQGSCDLPTADPVVFDQQVSKLIPYRR